MKHRLPRKTSRAEGPLDFDQHMELTLGPPRQGDPRNLPEYATDEERRAAWAAHRDELMPNQNGKGGVNPLTRPWAFWQYEYPGKKRRGESDEHALERLGLLMDFEKVLQAKWRKVRAQIAHEEWAPEEDE